MWRPHGIHPMRRTLHQKSESSILMLEYLVFITFTCWTWCKDIESAASTGTCEWLVQPSILQDVLESSTQIILIKLYLAGNVSYTWRIDGSESEQANDGARLSFDGIAVLSLTMKGRMISCSSVWKMATNRFLKELYTPDTGHCRFKRMKDTWGVSSRSLACIHLDFLIVLCTTSWILFC